MTSDEREQERQRRREFGAHIRTQREAKLPVAWTQAHVAGLVGVRREWINQIEGGAKPGADVRRALVGLFGEPAAASASPAADIGTLVSAITDLVTEMRLARERDQDAAAAMVRAAEALLAVRRPEGAGASTEPGAPLGIGK